MSCRPWGRKEPDTTEPLTLSLHFTLLTASKNFSLFCPVGPGSFLVFLFVIFFQYFQVLLSKREPPLHPLIQPEF